MTDSREVLARATQAIAGFTGAERVWFFLFDRNTNRLEAALPAWNLTEAMAEQMKVSDPGVNNIYEVLLMGVIAVLQIVLFALAAAGVQRLSMFNNTEFLLLTVINVAQTVVAFQINAATLMRTISSN